MTGLSPFDIPGSARLVRRLGARIASDRGG
jgi:hypothetical protein